MFRTMMKAKIHRARVTEANLNYVGSITIDQNILDETDILPHEKVQIVNNNNGARLETYVISGERGSGVICLNGAAARLVQKNDIVIIVSYALVASDELAGYKPKVALMDEENRVTRIVEQEPPLTAI
ncbi:aspartate 1-decarboxylase [Virgibacillus siamensis]|uniref:Aspartate 1-decarboxylase n=1 Tax=Virgibacillus siamensis TaxID=480071 RepID=A0ABP3QYH8_9BACI